MHLMGRGLRVATIVLVLGTSACSIGTAKKTTITYWCPWGGIWGDMQKKLVNEFNNSNNKVNVKFMTVDGGTLVQKFLTAQVAGAAPDMLAFWGFTPMSLAPKKVLLPLDSFIKSDLKEGDFIPAMWKQFYWEGHTWALAYGASANCLIYNTQAFKTSGLGNPPRTLEDIELYSAKLKREENGKLSRIGFLPSDEWQGFFHFTYSFGADYFNEKTKKITANSPAVINAIKWAMDYYNKQGGVSTIDGLTRTFGGDSNDPFIKGKLTMRLYHSWFMSQIGKFAPKLEYSISELPLPGGPGPNKWTLLGSDSVAIPAGSRHPKEAWEFVKWMVTYGQDRWGDIQGINSSWLPSKIKWPESFPSHAYNLYLESCKKARPIPSLPVIDQLIGTVNMYADQAIRGKKSPEAAMTAVDTEVQREYDRWMKRRR